MNSPDPDIRLPERPWWVAIGLWGVPTRTAALVYLYISLGLTVASIAAGFVFPLYWGGCLLIFAAMWYWLAIRWVDQHGGWGR
jgi:hypothetical protein